MAPAIHNTAIDNGNDIKATLGTRVKQWTRKMRLRDQITIAFWVVLLPVLGISGLNTTRLSGQTLLRAQERELRTEGLLISSIVTGWLKAASDRLQGIAEVSIANLPEQELSALLRREIRGPLEGGVLSVWTTEGRLLASSQAQGSPKGSLPTITAMQIGTVLGAKRIGQYLAGQDVDPVFFDVASHADQQIYMDLFIPVLDSSVQISKNATQNSLRKRVKSILSFSIPLGPFVASSGLAKIDQAIELGIRPGQGQQVTTVETDGLPSILFLSKYTGRAIFGYDQTGKLRLDHDPAIRPTLPFLRKGLRDCNLQSSTPLQQCQKHASYNGKLYVIGYNLSANNLVIVTAIPESIARQLSNQISEEILAIQLLVLGIGTLIIRICAQKLANPIDEAVIAIQDLSDGDFDVSFKHQAIGEIAELQTNIIRTSERLVQLLDQEKAAAVSLQQMQTAKLIQKDFLPASGQQLDGLSVASLCEPALAVGADWYDLIPLQGGSLMVVADVCDKGVASALYMSVFRSLVRFFALQLFADTPSNPAEGHEEGLLADVISRVNRYMAANHQASSMFATVFLALHRPEQQALVVVNAGHESVIHRSEQTQQITRIARSGPAVGIFETAQFKASRIHFAPGDVMLMFSDGLPDTCNPEEERFGQERIETLFRELDLGLSQQTLADSDWCQQMLDQLHARLLEFRREADPFDDLTIMVAKANGSA